jgi:hypothetical protein
MSRESITRIKKEQVRLLLENEYFGEWIAVHLEQNEQRRLRTIAGELTAFVSK